MNARLMLRKNAVLMLQMRGCHIVLLKTLIQSCEVTLSTLLNVVLNDWCTTSSIP
jgi:hypothetical protein